MYAMWITDDPNRNGNASASGNPANKRKGRKSNPPAIHCPQAASSRSSLVLTKRFHAACKPADATASNVANSTGGDVIGATRQDGYSRARLANCVYWSRKASRVDPVGPLRCLDTMISAMPRWSESGL